MTRLVMKFGGTSMADPERILHAARLVQSEVEAGRKVAVVVSAMAGVTNQMVAWTDIIGPAAQGLPSSDDEYDVVVTSGEQVTTGLMAMALRSLGVPARSWLSWQAGIITDGVHGKAKVVAIEADDMAASIDSGVVAVIPGFQGVTRQGRLTALGRGGSDTSATAVAAALDCPCDIYTDVDGVFTTDPRLNVHARMLPRISYEEMLELASLGAKVLHSRSVGLAMCHRTPLRVLNSRLKPGEQHGKGTLVCHEDEILEQRIVSGVTLSADESRITLMGLPEDPTTLGRIFTLLGEAELNVDMIVQSPARMEGRGNLLFTVGRRDADKAVRLLAAEPLLKDAEINKDDGVAKVSIVGAGMRSHADVAGTLFRALADKGVPVQAVATSEIKISVLVDGAWGELAARALHTAFELDA
ncbi:aspartate kinase [Brevundimonas sp. 2R-24]|uniref:Aspartokinase n=1 Tax=Peiella sedimenti TaxID=3061083 RepID=A0ABT8SNG4_9CAUL|nr:aspartate kinase [Caulobacteraceae bacterium XZ-24]